MPAITRDQGRIRGWTPHLPAPAVPRARQFPAVDELEPGWRDRAACRDEDPELFFPVGTGGPALDQVADAKAVCARCDVIASCGAWAEATGQQFGVWGGRSEEDRSRAKRAARRAVERERAKAKRQAEAEVAA